MSNYSLRDLLMKESQGGLMGRFGVVKTFSSFARTLLLPTYEMRCRETL